MATQTTERSLDELAKGLATGTLSRGKAIRWMGGALLGAALASVPGMALANDDCRSLGRECRRDSQCCSGNCVRRGDDKVCACPEGQRRCGDRCVNLQRNERHCGECFNRCAEGEECVGGECQGGGCPSGTVKCFEVGNTCVPGCPDGQILDCLTGQCLPACAPDQPCCRECCCSCDYFDANNNIVRTCHGGFPRNNNACVDICRANAPAGTRSAGASLNCPLEPQNFLCGPAPDGTGTVCSSAGSCTPPA